MDALRKKIEDIDSKMVKLMIERNDTAGKIGGMKKERGISLRNLEVEKEVVKRYRDMAKGSSLPEDVSEAVARILIETSVILQSSMLRKECKKKITIVGGRGKMGKWLNSYFTGMGATVNSIGRTEGKMEDAKDSDVIIVSVPISSIATYMKEVDAVCKDDALIFDISSVKSPFSGLLKEMAERRKVCSVHPMFGPSVPSMFGRNVIVCDCGNKQATEEAKELFDNDSSNIIMTTIERHDELMAYELALAHASNIVFFTAIRECGIPFDELENAASTTFKGCLRSCIPVSEEDPALYHEIQRLNINADKMWGVYEKAFKEVKKASLAKDADGFTEIMTLGRSYLTGDRP